MRQEPSPHGPRFLPQRQILILLGLAVLALALAWSRLLDGWSLRYLSDALKGSGVIYATARSVNALVSVLQGTEVNAVFISFSVGEILDPINDLIERFSGLVLLALGSLALQQLLITILAHEISNALFTLLALTGLAIAWRAPPRRRKQGLQLLCFVLALRLLLPMIVLTENAIEALYLRESEARHLRNIESFRSQLETVGRQVGVASQEQADAQGLEEALRRVEEARLEGEAALATTQAELNRAEAALRTLPTASVWKPWVDEPQEVVDARDRIASLEQRSRQQARSLEDLAREASRLREDLDCLERRAAGESCSLAEGALGLVRAADLRPQLVAVSQRVDEFSGDLIQLLTSLLFKSVLLPLAGLWLALRISAALARKLGL